VSLAKQPLAPDPDRTGRAPSRLRRSLRVSISEGVVAELTGACANSAVLTAWALFLGLPAPLVGLLSAMPFTAQALQLPGAWASALFGNRRTALWAIGLSRQAPLLLCALPFAPLAPGVKQGILLGVAAASSALAVAGNNAWTGWMGELVPARIRGRYFGRRSSFCAFGAAAAGLAAGLALDRGGARGMGIDPRGAGPVLAAISLASCVFGAATWALLARQHAPADRRLVPRKPRLADALAPLRSKSARKLLAFQVAWSGSSGLSAGFYALHMVTALHMGFVQIAVYNTAIAIARMIAAPLWGRMLDRAGARSVLSLAAFGLCLSPPIWMLVRKDNLWPLALDAMLCGVLMAAQSLSSFSLSLSVAEPRERNFHLAAFAAAGGIATGLGAAAGGVVLRQLPAHSHLFGLSLVAAQLLFLLADAGRVVAAFLALRVGESKLRGSSRVGPSGGGRLIERPAEARKAA
jgi:MFS family permease